MLILTKFYFLYSPILSDRSSTDMEAGHHGVSWVVTRVVFLELLGSPHQASQFTLGILFGFEPHTHVGVAASIQDACVCYLKAMVHHESTPSSITPVSSSTYAAWSIRSPKPCPHIPYFPSVVLRLYIPGMSPDFTLVDSSSSL